MSVYDREYTIDPTHGKYKKMFRTSERDIITGKRQEHRQYITFAGIRYYY